MSVTQPIVLSQFHLLSLSNPGANGYNLVYGNGLSDRQSIAGRNQTITTGLNRPRETPMKYEQYDTIYPSHKASSWMPVDTTSHWHWNNPLNLMLALPMLMLVLSLLISL
jgi:hypothetical protein